MIVPGEGFLVPSSRAQGFFGGGGGRGLDEIVLMSTQTPSQS